MSLKEDLDAIVNKISKASPDEIRQLGKTTMVYSYETGIEEGTRKSAARIQRLQAENQKLKTVLKKAEERLYLDRICLTRIGIIENLKPDVSLWSIITDIDRTLTIVREAL